MKTKKEIKNEEKKELKKEVKKEIKKEVISEQKTDVVKKFSNKKYGLFSVLLVILLLVVVATYFIKGRGDSISYLAIGDVFVNFVQSFYYFSDTVIFIVTVGGLYGALNKTLVYKKLVKKVASCFDNKKKVFVIVSTVIFALLSALTGLNMLLLIFIPFVVSVILMLGYDKLVALSSTVLAVIVGLIGGIFVTFKESSSYSISYTTFDKLVGLDGHFDTVIPRIILLVLSVGLLIFYIVNHIKKLDNGEIKDELGKSDVFLVEAKSKSGKVVNVNDSKVKVWPLVVMGLILLVLLVLGYLPWNSLFGIEVFDEFHTWLTELKVGNYVVFTSLISSNFSAFGSWGSLGLFMMGIVLIAVFLVILKFVAKVKFSDIMDGFIYGVKKMIPAAMIAMLAYSVLVCAYNNGFIETVITAAADKFGDNVVVDSLISLVGSILHVDQYYTVGGVFTPMVSSLTEKANLSVYSVMFQSLYGLVQVFGPTSLLLIVGLSYLDVPYKKWLKYIWRFVLGLIIVIFVMLMVLSLI